LILKQKIIILIKEQQARKLKELNLENYNLNYLIEDQGIPFDYKISPLLAACYIGKIEIVLLLLQNSEIDIELVSLNEGI
jgi:hypothetical protein